MISQRTASKILFTIFSAEVLFYIGVLFYKLFGLDFLIILILCLALVVALLCNGKDLM